MSLTKHKENFIRDWLFNYYNKGEIGNIDFAFTLKLLIQEIDRLRKDQDLLHYSKTTLADLHVRDELESLHE